MNFGYNISFINRKWLCQKSEMAHGSSALLTSAGDRGCSFFGIDGRQSEVAALNSADDGSVPLEDRMTRKFLHQRRLVEWGVIFSPTFVTPVNKKST